MTPSVRAAKPWPKVIALCSVLPFSPGCAGMLSATLGANVLATPRANTQFGASANAHIETGPSFYASQSHAPLVGAELNVRATNDYGHGSLGFSGAYLYARPKWATFARLGFAPIGGSYRNSAGYYALNTGLEWGFAIAPGGNEIDVRYGTILDAHALLVTLRADVEYRPGQSQADLFFSLNIGYARYGFSRMR